MGFSIGASRYLLPLMFTGLLVIALFFVVAGFARRGVGTRLWKAVVSQRSVVVFFTVVLLFVVAFGTFLKGYLDTEHLRARAGVDFGSRYNLVAGSPFGRAPITATLITSATLPDAVVFDTPVKEAPLAGQRKLASSVIAVRPGSTYRYSLYTSSQQPSASGAGNGRAHVRFLWLDASLRTLSWQDSPEWDAVAPRSADLFHAGAYQAPAGSRYMRFEVWNVGRNPIVVSQPAVSQDGVYVEQLPNGTQGAIAFSLDWESAMGGPIHSIGMEQHNAASAAEHGIRMRQGADWLNNLFVSKGISATFYATGYNLIEGNTSRRTFSGDPTYQWASPKYGWGSDYWLTHKWFSDDPYSTAKEQPGWYFGDQTRKLMAAGNEIGTLTFGHIYVRGSNPSQLATDLDQWLAVAGDMGVPRPTTFAFPWRSSNSISSDFYDVLYERGIRAVTRLYAPDLQDLYAIGAPLVYTDVRRPTVYSKMQVMPDFLLGAPSINAGEEGGEAGISLQGGLEVITQTLERRGVTSFWNHPEQLGDAPSLAGVRQTWEGVVSAAVKEGDNGRLWISTVANITAYERDLLSVTATLDKGFLGLGGWKLSVRNDSGRELSGVTLTLPGEVSSASSADATVQTVTHPTPNSTRLSDTAKPAYPARQLVLSKVKPGVTTIEIRWTPGEEPLS
ncbi:MAG: hypothetical protein IVW55_08810 [Chloroflexi bacterium]|nr:hypothetical protein [Chloroflexota bacterium]